MDELIVVKDKSEKISVVITPEIDDEEKEEWAKNGEEIIARYHLDGSLAVIGILVGEALQYPDSFGYRVEELLTKMAQDIYKKGGNDKV